jgi:two-component system sensor histidine kinase SenX3
MQMDRQGMDDVVTNLLSNAWKYKRGDRVRITVRTARRGRYAELVVSDDGVGIPREERRRVFEMFYRADQLLTDQVAGTGLGLALVRSAVREHKGTVRIEAGVGGRGAAFRLRFPLDLMGIVAEESASLGLSADSRGKLDGEPGGTAPASAQGNPGPPDGGPGNQT